MTACLQLQSTISSSTIGLKDKPLSLAKDKTAAFWGSRRFFLCLLFIGEDNQRLGLKDFLAHAFSRGLIKRDELSEKAFMHSLVSFRKTFGGVRRRSSFYNGASTVYSCVRCQTDLGHRNAAAAQCELALNKGEVGRICPKCAEDAGV